MRRLILPVLPVLLGLAGCGDVTAIPGDAPVPRAAPASVAQQADAAAATDLPDRQSVCGPDAPPEVQENCARERPRTQSVTRPKERLDDPLALDRPDCGPGAPLSLDPRCAPLGTAPGRGPVVAVPRDRPPSPGEVAEARADLETRRTRIESGQTTPLSGESAALERERIR